MAKTNDTFWVDKAISVFSAAATPTLYVNESAHTVSSQLYSDYTGGAGFGWVGTKTAHDFYVGAGNSWAIKITQGTLLTTVGGALAGTSATFTKTTEQLRLAYDAANYWKFVVYGNNDLVLSKGTTRFLICSASIGNNNIFLGLGTGNTTTTGNTNIGLGSEALAQVTSGAGNYAAGRAALYGLTTGQSNFAMGYYSLLSLTGGAYNIGIGNNSLQSVTTGVSNVAIGVSAGQGAGTSSSGNVFIGYQAGYSEAGSNKLYISNTSTSNLIVGDFSTGIVTVAKIQITTGANNDYYLKSDASGNATWAAIAASQVYKGTVDGDDGKYNGGGTALIDGTGTAGWYYRCNDAGTYDYGNPNGNSITLAIGDDIYYNGTIWQKIAAASGITTLNTLIGTTQTFATGTAGNDFAISSSTTVHTFDLPDASATARGVITTGTQTIAGGKTFTSDLTVAKTTTPILYVNESAHTISTQLYSDFDTVGFGWVGTKTNHDFYVGSGNSWAIKITQATSVVSFAVALADSQLATISTAGKVSGTAITSGNIGTSGAITTSSTITINGASYVKSLIVQNPTAATDGSQVQHSPKLQLICQAAALTSGGAFIRSDSVPWSIFNEAYESEGYGGGCLVFKVDSQYHRRPFAIDEQGRMVLATGSGPYTIDGESIYGFHGEDLGSYGNWPLILDGGIAGLNKVVVGNPTTDVTSDLYVTGVIKTMTSGARGTAYQVIGAQQAAVANATDAATVITQLNALLAKLRTHGLIAT